LLADRLVALVGCAALAIHALPHARPADTMALDPPGEATGAEPALKPEPAIAASAETVLGAYGGVSYTHRSEVRIANPGKVDLTVKDFAWEGQPFKSPIYYGLRVQRWSDASAVLGAMLDFTHAKAIARADDVATYTGTRNGRPVAPKARIGDVFKHLEFSHGHNMVTLNGVLRLPATLARVRPYIGVGGGISLPHTEIGFRDEPERTYEYQYAGPVGQVLGGLEIDLGRLSVFVEYKLSYAPYEVPLSHEPRGFLLVNDLWRQFSAWWRGERPPGGRLATDLVTHHGISGVLVRVGARPRPDG
jgi:hypothetical protein